MASDVESAGGDLASNADSRVEVLDEEDGSDQEATEEEIAAYAEFLGVDPEKEPYLMWIAAQGVSAPVPHPWKACQEGEEVFYFNFETKESMWDHPSDTKFRALVEKYRALGPKGEPKNGEGHLTDEEEAIAAYKRKTAAAASSGGRSRSSSPESRASGAGEGQRRGGGGPRSPDSAASSRGGGVDQRSPASEAGGPRSAPSSAAGSPAVSPSGPKGGEEKAGEDDQEDSKSFVSEAIGSDSEVSQQASPVGAAKAAASSPGAADGASKPAPEGKRRAADARSSRSSSPRSASSRSPPPPAARAGSGELSPGSRSSGSGGRRRPRSRSRSRSRSESRSRSRSAGSRRSPRSASSPRSGSPPRSQSPQAPKAPAGEATSPASVGSGPSRSGSPQAPKAPGEEATSPASVGSGPSRSPVAGGGASPNAAAAAAPQPATAPVAVDHGPCSARSSTPSEAWEDYRSSDWGVGSPAVSVRTDPPVGPECGSLEPSREGSKEVDGLKAGGGGAPKTWGQLRAELRDLAAVLEGVRGIRVQQQEYLHRLKTGRPRAAS